MFDELGTIGIIQKYFANLTAPPANFINNAAFPHRKLCNLICRLPASSR